MSLIEKFSIQTKEDAIQFIKGHIRIKASMENVMQYEKNETVPIATIRETLNAIKEIEDHFSSDPSWDLAYWVGKGLSWCGEHYSSLEHLEAAYRMSENILENSISPNQKQTTQSIDRNDIAFEIGECCLKIKHAAMGEKAVTYLSQLMEHCTGYHPGMGLLADAYFRNGDFQRAAEVADVANERLHNDPYWPKHVSDPKFLTNMMSRCYSRMALQARDAGDIAAVVRVLELARGKSVIKPIDNDLLNRLKEQEKILIQNPAVLNDIITSKPMVLTIRRELKKMYPEITFDFEAIKREIERRLGVESSSAPNQPVHGIGSFEE